MNQIMTQPLDWSISKEQNPDERQNILYQFAPYANSTRFPWIIGLNSFQTYLQELLH